MWDAREKHQDAVRRALTATCPIDRAVAEQDAAHWRAAAEEAREDCGVLGAFLVTLALEYGGVQFSKTLGTVFGDLARDAWDRARDADRRAKRALQECDALRQRVRELEGLVADIIPGVGEPGRAARI